MPGSHPRVSLAHPGFSPRAFFTEEGGLAVRLTNKTGAASVKGALVGASDTADLAVDQLVADGFAPIGCFYQSGVPDGAEAWVVCSGMADVLLEDGTTATRGYWARTSITAAGRANATNASPPGGTIQALEIHAREIGHCLESKAAGTGVTARVLLHFN